MAWWVAPIILFSGFTAVTHASFAGDGYDYALQIANIADGHESAAHLWESGHLLWRPLGFAVAPLFLKLTPDRLAWTPALKIYCGLIVISWLSGLAATMLVTAVALRLSGNIRLAWTLSLLFVCGDAVLCYSQSAMPYISGLALLLGGLYWQLEARPDRKLALVGPGFLYGLATLFWMPYALAIPAAVSMERFLTISGRGAGRIWWTRSIAQMSAAGLLIVAGIAGAALLAGAHTVPGAGAWLLAAGHGLAQNRQGLRAITGVSRLFIDLGRDGVFFKRYAFHDPYYPVTVVDLFRHSLWKVALFYTFLASLTWVAWRSRRGRSALVLLGMAAGVALLTAIFMFEPSSPERFLPVLPFLLMAVAAGWHASTATVDRAARAGVFGFALLLPVLNWSLLAKSWEFRDHATAQVAALRAHTAPEDTVLTLTPAEPLEELDLHPFDPLNRGRAIHPRWLIDAMRADASEWRFQFAERVEENWARGRAAWVERAALDDIPSASVLWVEGDNPKVHWKDFPDFFRTLEYDADTGGASGFMRVSRSATNQARLEEILVKARIESGTDINSPLKFR